MTREYGNAGWIGLGVPQANPTVEMEMRRLVGVEVELLTTRLTSAAATSDQRLVAYLETLPTALESYDVLAPDLFCFACTGSSYLLGAAREDEIVDAARARFGYPVLTAARAILQALGEIGATRIAVLAPYPAPLVEAGVAYWREAGLTVAEVRRLDLGSADTRRIYGLRSADALTALDEMNLAGVDAVLITGTGMPTLGALVPAARRIGRPVLSSNYCLAWAALRVLGIDIKVWDASGPTLPPPTRLQPTPSAG